MVTSDTENKTSETTTAVDTGTVGEASVEGTISTTKGTSGIILTEDLAGTGIVDEGMAIETMTSGRQVPPQCTGALPLAEARAGGTTMITNLGPTVAFLCSTPRRCSTTSEVYSHLTYV